MFINCCGVYKKTNVSSSVVACIVILQCVTSYRCVLAQEASSLTELRQLGALFFSEETKKHPDTSVLISPYWRGGNDGLMHLKNLPNLDSVVLYSSGVSDAGLCHLASALNITYLFLSERQITSKGLSEIAKIKSIKTLVLLGNNIDNECISAISSLPQLSDICISSKSVTDDCIPWIKKIPNLKRIRLENCLISPIGIQDLRRAKIDVVE